MKIWRGSGTIVLFFALQAAAPLFAAQTVLLVAGERPPYLGANLPQGGYVAELVTLAFKRQGYPVKFEFVTWARAGLQAAKGDADGMLASGPENSGLADAAFAYSKRFPGGISGFLKKKSLKFSLPAQALKKPDLLFQSLAPYKVGAVRGGVSVAGFEAATTFAKEWALDDLKNLDALARGQVQLALVDQYTAVDLMVSQRPNLIGQLEFMRPALAQNDYYLAFSKRAPQHQQLLKAFNAGLAELEKDGTLEKIMNKHGLFAPKTSRHGKTVLTIGTVNNSDMQVMQKLSSAFEKQHPQIALDWRVLDENTLRLRLLSDLAISDGQFDIMTIGTYELPIWARRGWLAPVQPLAASYEVDDLLPTVKKHLSYQGQLYALPFYAESIMTYYRKDLFAKTALAMPAQPSYQDIAGFAARIHDPAKQVYGICLRGKPGWGENMALIGTLVHAHGGRWFDMQWHPELASAQWNSTLTLYAGLLEKYGPPHPEQNGFNENLALFSSGHCGIWIDATVAAGMLFDAKRSQVSAQLGYAPAPVASNRKGSAWLWSWALALPNSSPHKAEARQFIAWATSKSYIQSVAATLGWVGVPPGTRTSTYANPNYLKAAPFARFVLNAIENADSADSTNSSNSGAAAKPYTGVQYISIPEFQVIGDEMGLEVAKVLRGEQSVDKALKRSQNFATDQMKKSGYFP